MINRKDKLRHVQKESNLNFDEGVKKNRERNESVLSVTQNSQIDIEEEG